MSSSPIAGRLAALFVGVCLSTLASATAQRTFVARRGVDNLSCSIVAPCRSFAAAVAATSSGGEVIVLDSAGYGAVTITQSVSIIAPPGVYAGISVFAGDGVAVSAGPADNVVLRGLTINGQGGTNGIHVTSGRETHIEDCTVANLSQNGILVEGGSAMHIARAVVRGNNNAGVSVMLQTPTTIMTTLVDSTLTGNNMAFVAITYDPGATINAAVSRVTASANSYGFYAYTLNAGPVTMVIADSIVTDSTNEGIYVFNTNATVIVSGSSLEGNGSNDLYQASGGVIRTAGNNAVTGRGAADIGGTLTMNPLK